MKKLLTILILSTINFSFSQGNINIPSSLQNTSLYFPPTPWINFDENPEQTLFISKYQIFDTQVTLRKSGGMNTIHLINALTFNKEDGFYYNKEFIGLEGTYNDDAKANGTFANVKTVDHAGNRNIMQIFRGIPLYHITYFGLTDRRLSERYWANGLPHGLWKIWDYMGELKIELVFFKGKLIEYRGFLNKIETNDIEKVFQEIIKENYYSIDWKLIYDKIRNKELITI